MWRKASPVENLKIESKMIRGTCERSKHRNEHNRLTRMQKKLENYLVIFLIFEEILEMLKRNRLEKLVSPVKSSA